MRRLPFPVDDGDDVYAQCTDVRTKVLRAKYLSIRDTISDDGVDYFNHGTSGSLHLFQPRRAIGRVSHKQLKANYKSRLLNKERPERAVYDRIRLSTRRCPYCDVGKIKQVDHFLPQARYSSVIVNPLNLLPSLFAIVTLTKTMRYQLRPRILYFIPISTM